MITDYPQSMPHVDHLGVTHEAEGFGGRMLTWTRQAMCGLVGHEELLQFGKGRMSLKCALCGHETSGWELNEPRPITTVRGDALRHRIARTQLMSMRRIA